MGEGGFQDRLFCREMDRGSSQEVAPSTKGKSLDSYQISIMIEIRMELKGNFFVLNRMQRLKISLSSCLSRFWKERGIGLGR
jgi:hypothetical protein